MAPKIKNSASQHLGALSPGSGVDKKKLSEADICEKFITPAIQKAGWDTIEQIYREYTLRPGRVVVRGHSASRDKKSVLRADYVLFYKLNIPLVVIEAKDNNYAMGAGMPQAINYGELLNVPFSFSCNGDGFVFRDATMASGTLETNLTLDQFPSPAALWGRFCAWKGWSPEVRQVAEYPYSPSKTPRYYQLAEHFDLLLDRPDAIDALEQAILQLAVRGLLVPQDACEEPASSLLQRIDAEKRRLGGSKAKPIHDLIIDENAQPFSLPKNWCWTRWDDIARQIGDINHKMPQEKPDGIPYVSPADFTVGNGINFISAKKISMDDYEELTSKIKPERGDLIYPRYGTIGKVRFVETDQIFLASYSCAIIKCLPGFVVPRYQFWVSLSRLIIDQANEATNKTTQPNVGLKSIQAFLFPLPPLAEQHRIVTRVEELRLLCAQLRDRLTGARKTQSILSDALVSQATAA